MKKIPLYSRTYGTHEVLLDEEDYWEISDFQWSLSRQRDCFYAVRHTSRLNPPRRLISMHRFIMGVDEGDSSILVDHINHNTLDNRRFNLRLCNNSENHKNAIPYGSSKYLGVSWNKAHGKWLAKIVINGKHVHIGMFPGTAEGEIIAAEQYDCYASDYHGEFANLNFK